MPTQTPPHLDRSEGARLQALAELDAEVTGSDFDFDRLLRRVAQSAQRFAGADGAGIAVLDGRRLVCRIGVGSVSTEQGTQVDLQHSLTGRAFRSGRVEHTADASSDGRVDPVAYQRCQVRSFVMVPIAVDGAPCSVLSVGWDRPHAYSEGELRSLELFKLVLAAAFTRAQRAEAELAAQRERQVAEERARIIESFYAAGTTMRGVLELRGADLRFVSLNPAAAAHFGGTPRELEGRAMSELPAHAGELPMWLGRLHEAQAHGGTTSWEWHRKLEGTIQVLACTVTALPLGAGVQGLAVMCEDVSEKVLASRRLIELERLALIGKLTAGVAHEINNPLACVRMNLDLLERELAGPQRDGAPSEALRDCVDAAERIETIVRDLKRVAWREGASDASVWPVDELVGETLRLARARTGGAITIEYGGAAGLSVRAPRSRMGQVLLNLVVNAVDAVDGTLGPIAGPPRVAIRVGLEGANAVIEVEDNGPGISPAAAARLFEPFFTTKPRGVGTGLGLSLSRDFVTEAGGRLELARGTLGGARFRLVLPAVDPA